MTTQTKNLFVEMYPTETQAVLKLYESLVASSSSASDMSSAISDLLITNYSFSTSAAAAAAVSLLTYLPQMLPSSADTENFQIALSDYVTCKELISEDKTATDRTTLLLLSFIVFYRKYFHLSGWIKYDKKNIFHFAGLSKLSSSTQEKLTRYLHEHYGLDMRVVGSNQPIPCFSFKWAVENDRTNPPGTEKNPYISGTFTPEGLKNFQSRIND